jgi:enoyl-CoA hydratase
MEFVKTEMQDGICVLRLDHGKPNSISKAVADELTSGLAQAEESADAVVILGRAGMFSGGFDLPTMGKGPEAVRAMLTAGADLLMAIYDHPKPIVIGCAGHAIAMGAFITMAGDERIGASGDFKIG